MLDILGNVFGRSKKEKSVTTPASPGTPAAGDSTNHAAGDGFAVVGQDAGTSSAFIYPTMLTNEMLRTASSSTASSSSTPFARDTTPTPSDRANTWNSHTDSLTLQRSMNGINQINPMDQVPFVPHAAFESSSSRASDSKQDDVRRCVAAIDRVAGFLSASSQSEYNFSVEKNVIRESSASNWQTFA